PPGPQPFPSTTLFRSAYLAPDRPAHVTGRAVATNHQGQVEWAPYAAAIKTVERRRHLQALLDAGSGAADVVAACLRPPLYATRRSEEHTSELQSRFDL